MQVAGMGPSSDAAAGPSPADGAAAAAPVLPLPLPLLLLVPGADGGVAAAAASDGGRAGGARPVEMGGHTRCKQAGVVAGLSHNAGLHAWCRAFPCG